MSGSHVLVAPDKFKGSLTATEVADAVAAGIGSVVPGVPVRTLPVADGGDGTVAAAVAAGFRRVDVPARGPTGQRITASFALSGDTAVVELAEASGLHRLPGDVPAPLTASSAGTGDLIAAAIRSGARRIVLGVGGSACTDGGAGLLTALGARLLDSSGAELSPGGAALRELHRLELSDLDPALSEVDIELASDVDNPLLGPHGAAAVYGPQKGAGPAAIRVLEDGLRRWAEVAGPADAARPGAGAAGGVGFAALAVLHARRRPGIELLTELLGFDDALRDARLVVTGEGSLDEQTLRGKAPAGVAAKARKAAVPVVAVAGRCLLTPAALRDSGFEAAYALTDAEPDPARCIAAAGPLLTRVSARLAEDWLRSP
ncbi:glycerate kinase [Amycolatopsis sp. NPDC059021]|uniref:glycerate kinase n=1 Tax=Amycolatopsis sp. NPDC059021 TaxID=3346704 RepID=UPI00366F3393